MKKILLLGMLGVLGWMPYQAQAQVSINVNIGSQPSWGPVGYDHVDYYYLPDVECYYHVPKRQFIYRDNARWIFSASLPSRYRGYDLHSGYKVVLNSRNPYRNFDRDRVTYGRYRNVRSQHSHGMSRGQAKKYYSRDHDSRPRYNGRDRERSRGDYNHGKNKHDKGRGNDRGRGGDHGRGRH